MATPSTRRVTRSASNRHLVTSLAALGACIVASTGLASSPAPPSRVTTPAERRAAEAEFPADWFWGNDRQRRAHDGMIGNPAPSLVVSRWIGEPQDLAKLRGKVVVIDFWGTWCPPCMRALPTNKALVEEFGAKGLVFVAIHDHARGLDRLDAVIREHSITYPVAVDDQGRSAGRWNVAFWPTYGVIDRDGKVRAVGLRPERVRDVVTKLIAEPVPDDLKPKPEAPANNAANASTIAFASPLPLEWIERPAPMRAELKRLVGEPAPPLPDGQWLNGGPLNWDGLRGKVVLLDFWATWCVPCIKAIPELNRLQERYRRDGLVVIGICHARGAETMAEVAQRHRISYPVVSDPQLAAVRAYRVDTYPDYYLVDRHGRVRGVDLKSEHLEDAIVRLLREE